MPPLSLIARRHPDHILPVISSAPFPVLLDADLGKQDADASTASSRATARPPATITPTSPSSQSPLPDPWLHRCRPPPTQYVPGRLFYLFICCRGPIDHLLLSPPPAPFPFSSNADCCKYAAGYELLSAAAAPPAARYPSL
ncbi:hypothetical protein VPH35_124597 [Triticum aestivum]